MALLNLRGVSLTIGLAAFFGSAFIGVTAGCGGDPSLSGDSPEGSASGTAGSGATGSTSASSGSGGGGTGGGSSSSSDSSISSSSSASGGGDPEPVRFVGNITTSGQIEANFLKYWNQITPENESKWGSIEPQRDRMNWSSTDAIYKFAKDNKIPFKWHTFVWGSQQPGWIEGLPQNEQAEEVEELIREVCTRYPDIDMIDVVNEPPPHTRPATMAALGGEGASGYDWIVKAFELSRQYCPKAILILNDYNTIEYGNDNNNIINIAKKVKAAGAPIDAIGCQAHATANVPTATVKGFIDKIASETGLPVYITEYDLNIADDERQKQVMQDQFTMFWDDENIKGITLWGYIHGTTWVKDSGLIRDGQPRPAMQWLMEFLGK
ncbi:endo-1,4-beta-xylanase [Sorangium sp. So ce291]|uniref:endo-1,4-beta-xylanase n=1 Tax=Sorangium sp. So ce291 TaxID=3133294 RepID=UPI003F5E381D